MAKKRKLTDEQIAKLREEGQAKKEALIYNKKVTELELQVFSYDEVVAKGFRFQVFPESGRIHDSISDFAQYFVPGYDPTQNSNLNIYAVGTDERKANLLGGRWPSDKKPASSIAKILTCKTNKIHFVPNAKNGDLVLCHSKLMYPTIDWSKWHLTKEFLRTEEYQAWKKFVDATGFDVSEEQLMTEALNNQIYHVGQDMESVSDEGFAYGYEHGVTGNIVNILGDGKHLRDEYGHNWDYDTFLEVQSKFIAHQKTI